MKKYNVYSAKAQGCYRKDELIYVLSEAQYKRDFGSFHFSTITYDGYNRIYIKEA